MLYGHAHQAAIVVEIHVNILADLPRFRDGAIDELQKRRVGVGKYLMRMIYSLNLRSKNALKENAW
jgi:hypothetical protein